MKIKTLFKTIFCAGLILAFVVNLSQLYGNYIEKTQEPITDYIYNGFEEKSNYKSSNTILITYKSKLVVNLSQLYGNYIEKTQEPITDYIYNGFEEKSNYKSSNTILITYKSKQYRLHTGPGAYY